MPDHTAHIEQFYTTWLTMARGQLLGMQVLYGNEPCGPHADTIRVVEGQIELVENKLKIVQTRDVSNMQQENTRG